MELKGTQTEKNLQTAFAGESQAHTKYLYYASKAAKDGYVQISELFTETAKNEKIFHLCITPEGTRSKTADWKKGFYFIALKANIPILLYGLDYEKRLIQCKKTIIPSGDLEQDMRDIKLYFKDFKGKIPNNFTIGDVE